MQSKKRLRLTFETVKTLTADAMPEIRGGFITYPSTANSNRTCWIPCWPTPPPLAPGEE